MSRLRAVLALLLWGTFAWPSGVGQGQARPVFADAQEIALYRFVLAHSASYRRRFSAIGVDHASERVLAVLKRIEPRLCHSIPGNLPEASIYLGDPTKVENHRLLVFAELGTLSGRSRLRFKLFLKQGPRGWTVERAKRYAVPPEMMATAIRVVLPDLGPGPVYVDATSQVLRLLRRQGREIHPISEQRPRWKVIKGPYGIIDGSVVWLSRRLARVYLHTMYGPVGADVAAEYGGPVLVWHSGRQWHARKVENEWGGE